LALLILDLDRNLFWNSGIYLP